MCLGDMPQFKQVTGQNDEDTDEYKNPSSGVATPSWKLAAKINNTESSSNTTSSEPAPTQEGEMSRSEISG